MKRGKSFWMDGSLPDEEAIWYKDAIIYEISYEINNRPDWLWLPLQGIQRVPGIEE